MLTLDDRDRIVDIRGGKDQPMSRGYACAKGIQAHELHHGPERLLRPLRRTSSGQFEPVALPDALVRVITCFLNVDASATQL